MISLCPGSQKYKQPQPEILPCCYCGGEVELWSDELSAECPQCHRTTGRKTGGQSCLGWCRHARECVGPEIYAKHMAHMKKGGA